MSGEFENCPKIFNFSLLGSSYIRPAFAVDLALTHTTHSPSLHSVYRLLRPLTAQHPHHVIHVTLHDREPQLWGGATYLFTFCILSYIHHISSRTFSVAPLLRRVKHMCLTRDLFMCYLYINLLEHFT